MRFQIMDQLGHSTLDFDTATPDQLAAAEAKFLELTKGDRKCAAFKKEAGGGGTLIRAFDPTAEAIMFRPPLVGG